MFSLPLIKYFGERAMTLSTWLLILALVVASGTSRSIQSPSPTDPATNVLEEPEHSCWINGTWYNPCPGGEGQTPWTP